MVVTKTWSFLNVSIPSGDRKITTSSRNQEVLSTRDSGKSVSIDANCILISGQKRNIHLISSFRTQILHGSFQNLQLLDQFRNSIGRRRIIKESFVSSCDRSYLYRCQEGIEGRMEDEVRDQSWKVIVLYGDDKCMSHLSNLILGQPIRYCQQIPVLTPHFMKTCTTFFALIFEHVLVCCSIPQFWIVTTQLVCDHYVVN